jgi:uncharacterized repeat protein (TIGR02543 family)
MTSNSNFPFRSFRLGLALIFTLFMAVASWAKITGSGTESDPYVISSVDDWNTAAKTEMYFYKSDGFVYLRLDKDLDFSGKKFEIFGTFSWGVSTATIHFDGDYHTISGISYTTTGSNAAPFGGLRAGGSISNLTVSNSSFTGKDNVAGILVKNYGTVTNCHVTSTVTLKATDSYCGGIAAKNGGLEGSTPDKGVITGCTVGAKFDLAQSLANSLSFGGIAGYQYGGEYSTISNCTFFSTQVTANTLFGCISSSNDGTFTDNAYRPVNGYNAFSRVEDGTAATIVYAVSGIPSGVTVSPDPVASYNGTLYYAPNTQLTVSTGDENKAFVDFSTTGATASLSTDKRSATLTVGEQDITVTASLLTIGGTCGSGVTWRMADTDKNGSYETLNIGGTGALTEYADGNAPWYSDFRTTITRVNIGDDITTIPANTFYGISDEASIVFSTLDFALKFKEAAFAAKLRVPFGKYLFKATETADKKPAYDIATADDLRHLAAAVKANNSGSGKTFFQTANIDLASVGNFKPIGYADSTTFAGNYDGNRHVISGLKVSGSLNYAGLFGTVSGEIKNVILMNPSVSSSNNGADVGAIIGKLTGNASNCYFYGGYQINAIGKMSKSAEVSNVSQAYTLKVAEHISVDKSADDPENGFQYDADNDGTLENYYRDGLELTLSHDETIEDPAEGSGYVLTYLLNGQKNGNISGNKLTVGSATNGKTLSVAIRSDGEKHQITYINADGTTKTAEAIALDGTESKLAAGWYFVGRNINFDHTLTLEGNVNLVLGDRKTMNVEVTSGDAISASRSFAIYGQTNQSGMLKAVGQNHGINNSLYGITINSGSVTAKGGYYGIYSSQGIIKINGGTVSATGGINGINSASMLLAINGGNVTAVGENGFGIYGGSIELSWTALTDVVKASSFSSSVHIAAGKYLKDEDGNVYSDKLDANQLSDIANKTLTPAIPVNYIDENGDQQTIYSNYTVLTNDVTDYIENGVINLTGGWYVVKDEVSYTNPVQFSGKAQLILVDGAKMGIETSGKKEHGIFAKNDLTIYGQNHQSGILDITANGEDSYGIIGSENVTINGGKVSATGELDGVYANNGDITLLWTNSTDAVKASSFNLGNSTNKVLIDKKAFKDEDGNVYSGELSSLQLGVIANKTLMPCYAVTFDAQNRSDLVTVTTTFDENGVAHVAKPEDPTLDGYTFLGWFTEKNGDTKFDFAGAVTANMTLYAKWGVPYVDANGEPQMALNCTMLTDATDVSDLPGGWYVVKGEVRYLSGVKFSGDAHLILADGANMEVNVENKATDGIHAFENLTIYGQSGQTGTLTVVGDHSYSGIYGEGVVTITGGNVSQPSGFSNGITSNGGIAISGGNVTLDKSIQSKGEITITGGNVDVTTLAGNGIDCIDCNVTITGGSVTAKASYYGIIGKSSVTITGGSVTATASEYGIYGKSSVTITGGTVTATGGMDGISSYGDITLSLNNSSDYIQASRFNSRDGSVKIAKDKSLKDKSGYVYSGTLTARQVSSLKNQKLEDFTGTSVSFVDNSSGTPVVFVSIAVDGEGRVAAPAKRPFHSGKTFLGWFDAAEGGSEFDFNVAVTKNTAYAHWKENSPVEYINEKGETVNVTDYVLLAGDIYVDDLPGGKYVVQDEVRYTSQMKFNDEAILILANGAKLNVESSGFGNNGVSIWAKKNLTIYGQHVENGESGSLTASSTSGYGIFVEKGDFSMVGGSVTATSASGNSIISNGGISISWTNKTDYIKASSFSSGTGSVTIAEGKSFKDGNGNVYSGLLGNTQLATLKGQKLEPFEGTSVSFVDNSSGTPVVFASIAVDGEGHVAAPAKHPFHSGKTFLGWFDAPEGGSEFNFDAVTGNTAYAQWKNNESVNYINAKGETKSVTDYILLTSDIYVDDLPEGWYVVQGKVSYTSPVRFGGNANLILADGAEMNVETSGNAIYANGGNLTIYGQGGKKIEAGERVPSGKLTAIGNNGIEASDVIVVGGNVKALSNSENGYGILNHGNVVLGWTSATDSIKVSSYYINKGSVIIAEGKPFKDENGNVYRGKLTDEQIAAIKGKSLTSVPVKYIDEDGNEKFVAGCTELTSDIVKYVDKDDFIRLPGGWYVVENDVTLSNTLSFTGDLHLILADGAKLEIDATNGYALQVANNLNIYGQSLDTATAGALTLKARDYVIHVGTPGLSGSITISGGKINATVPEGDTGYRFGIVSLGNIEIKAGFVSVDVTSKYGIYTTKDIIISGGTVDVTTGIVTTGNVTIGNIILGYNNFDDYIRANIYEGKVKIAKGQYFVDESGKVYEDELSEDDVAAIAGKILTPLIHFSDKIEVDIPAVTYTGKPICPQPAVKIDENNKLTLNEDYTVTCENNLNASAAAKVIIKGAGKYFGEVEKTFTIQKATLTVKAENDTIVYGDEWSSTGEVEYSGFVNDETKDVMTIVSPLSFSCEYTQYGDVGKYAIKLNGELTADNYTIQLANGELTVEKKFVSVIWDKKTVFAYDGKEHAPTATADSDIEGHEAPLVVTGAAKEVGKYIATVALDENNAISKNYKLPEKMGRKQEFEIIEPIPYIDENGVEQTVTDVTVLTDAYTAPDDDGVIKLPAGWYAVLGKVEFSNMVEFGGDAHLILADGAEMNVNVTSSEAVRANGNLTIYGQSGQSGALNASSVNGNVIVSNGNNITINGGEVSVTSEGKGIFSNKSVVINGGSVTAFGGEYGIVGDKGITLGWTNSADRIKANSYSGIVTIATGKSFKDEDGKVYSGKLTDEQIADIKGKTLVPSFNGKFLSDKSIAVADIPVQKYADGKPVCPSVVVTDGKDTLKAGTDYTVACFNNTAVTSATLDEAAIAQITGKGNYAGEIQKRFFIWENIGDYAAVQVYKDKKGDSHAEINGEYEGTDAVNITEDIENVAVTFNRMFTPNKGFATIMLPFDINASKLTGVKSIIEFAGVFDNNGKNAVGMKYVWCNADLGKEVEDKGYTNCNELSGDLTAYTPYMVEMESATLGINGGVTLKPNSGASAGDARKDDWVFRGALQKKEWSGDENIIKNGRIWAFAGSERNGATIGQFRRIGGNTSVKPFRAYLVDCAGVPKGSDCEEYFENQSEPSYVSRYRFADVLASATPAENSLSAKKPMGVAASETASLEGMEVVIVNGDSASGERPTVIGRMNPATGEIRMLPRTKQTYDLKGRRVGNGKKAKGAYYRK